MLGANPKTISRGAYYKPGEANASEAGSTGLSQDHTLLDGRGSGLVPTFVRICQSLFGLVRVGDELLGFEVAKRESVMGGSRMRMIGPLGEDILSS